MISEQFEIVNGLRTRYLVGGPEEGEVLLFAHDGVWGGSADVTWDRLLPLAARNYRVIATDMLGSAGSSKVVAFDTSPFSFRAAHMLALLEKLGIEKRPHFIGSSFGGSVGLRALTDPALADKFASVTAIAGTGGLWLTPAAAAMAKFDGSREDVNTLCELLCDDFEGFADNVTRRHGWATTPGSYQAVVALQTPVPDALKPNRPTDPYPANLSSNQTPVLLVRGEHDVLFEATWADELAKSIPNATVEVLPYKHLPSISHPNETWQTLESFLAKVAA